MGNRLAVDLGGPAGHVAEQVDGQRDVGRPGHGQRLAVVERFQFGEFVAVFFQQVAQFPDQAAALRGGHFGPRPRLERPPGRMDRGVDIGLIARGTMGDDLARGRIVDLKSLSQPGRFPLPIDP